MALEIFRIRRLNDLDNKANLFLCQTIEFTFRSAYLFARQILCNKICVPCNFYIIGKFSELSYYIKRAQYTLSPQNYTVLIFFGLLLFVGILFEQVVSNPAFIPYQTTYPSQHNCAQNLFHSQPPFKI